MQYDFQVEGQALVVTLRGELDLHTCPEFKTKMTEVLITNSSVRYLIMNVNDLSFIDSSGLGVILGRYRELQERQGGLFFVQANPQIKRILKMSGFQKISEFVNSTSEALKRI